MPFYDLGTKGYWNAATNLPIIKSGKGENGAAYEVSVAGSTEIGGVTDWRVGDIIVFMNDEWTRIPGQATLDAYGGPVRAIEFVLDGAGAAIAAGMRGFLKVPYACAIESWQILANAAGSCVIDIWKVPYASHPATVSDSITGTAKPTLSAAAAAQSSTLTDWTTNIAAGDILAFKVDSAATVQLVTLVLNVRV